MVPLSHLFSVQSQPIHVLWQVLSRKPSCLNGYAHLHSFTLLSFKLIIIIGGTRKSGKMNASGIGFNPNMSVNMGASGAYGTGAVPMKFIGQDKAREQTLGLNPN